MRPNAGTRKASNTGIHAPKFAESGPQVITERFVNGVDVDRDNVHGKAMSGRTIVA